MREAAPAALELEHRSVPQHRLVLLPAQHEPGSAGAARAARLDAPAAGHPQVAPQHEAALEMEQQILAHCLDRLEQPPVEPLCELLARSSRMRRLDRHALSR